MFLPEVQMNNITRAAFLCLFLFAIIPISVSATESSFKPETVVHLEVVTNAAISPDGDNVAYIRRTQRAPEDDRGAPYTEMLLIPAEGGHPQQFTFRPHNVANLQWSPDGKYIYFQSHRPEVHRGTQVYRIPSRGGEAELLTKESSPVISYKISPDGTKIAYILQDPEPELIQMRKSAGDDWRIEDEFYRHRRIHIAELATEEKHVVTQFDKSVWDFVWSSDSEHLLIQATRIPDTDHSYMFKKMYLVPSSGTDTAELFVETEGKLGGMTFSPNGRYVAWHGALDISDPAEGTIFVADVTTREMWTVNPDFDGTVTWVYWKDNNTLIFSSEEKTWTRMSTVSYRGGERNILFDEREHPEFTSAQFADDNNICNDRLRI
jgi:Tol biopolymer transport system component